MKVYVLMYHEWYDYDSSDSKIIGLYPDMEALSARVERHYPDAVPHPSNKDFLTVVDDYSYHVNLSVEVWEMGEEREA